jgi:monofunctional glycosyltransferase
MKKKTEIKKFAKKAILLILILHAGYIFIIALLSLHLCFFNPPFGSLMIYRSVFDNIPAKKHFFVPVNYIKRKYINLLIYTEDPAFYVHSGIDIPSIISAAKVNYKTKQKLYGASTITQQLTRTLFLFPQKLYIRKYMEVIAALTINTIIPKERQIELYVNYAEWGRGIYGINSAAIYYYGSPVYKLTDDQVIRLITVLPSPVRYTPFNFDRRNRLSERYEKLNDMLNTLYTSH